jgi:hypothetical protein
LVVGENVLAVFELLEHAVAPIAAATANATITSDLLDNDIQCFLSQNEHFLRLHPWVSAPKWGSAHIWVWSYSMARVRLAQVASGERTLSSERGRERRKSDVDEKR